MVRRVLSAFLAWPLFSVPAVAGDALPSGTQQEVNSILNKQQITLADLFRVAELTNPALAAARAAVRVQAGRAREVGLYPNPVFEFEVEELSTDDPDLRKEKVSLMQPLVISGRRGNAVAAARADREAAVHAVEGTRRAIYRRVHSSWAEQLYVREADEVLEGLLDVARQTLQIAEARFGARAAPESHVTKALLELNELEIAGQRLARQRAHTAAELAALLGGTHVPLDRLVGALASDGLGSAVEEGDVDRHPAVRAAQIRVDAAEAALRAAESERVPDVGVFLSYGRIRPTDDGFLEAGLSVPLPLFDRNQGRVAESHALIAEARGVARRAQNDVRAALATAAATCQAIRDELRASEERMQPAAERALIQTQEGYRVGRVPFLELIDAQRTFSDIRLRSLELRRDLVIAEAELASLAGTGPYGETGEDAK